MCPLTLENKPNGKGWQFKQKYGIYMNCKNWKNILTFEPTQRDGHDGQTLSFKLYYILQKIIKHCSIFKISYSKTECESYVKKYPPQ